jgi:hypothetical protein
MRFFAALAIASLANALLGQIPLDGQSMLLQNNVTWDDHSLFINGQRLMIFSGEIHPFRLPVPSLWVDVLQKIKALGLNTVSVYMNWACKFI